MDEEVTTESEDLSRRVFLHKFGGAVAGIAGLIGLGDAIKLFGEGQKRGSGYGSSPYGGKREGK